MNPTAEIIFRISFGVLWGIYFFVRLVFQKRVKRSEEYTRVNEKQEMLLFRLFALAYLLLPFYFLTPWVDFAGMPFPQWLRWLGALINALGIVLFAWSHLALGNNWTAVMALAKEHEMVESGPYRYIRHPMYLAFFVTGAGFFILSANWLLGIVYFLPLMVMYVTRASREEQMMIERFGDQYREYMKRTGRLLPRLFVWTGVYPPSKSPDEDTSTQSPREEG